MNHEVLTFITGFGRHRVPFLSERRRGGRAVECTGLENRQGCEPFVGSNPTLSARLYKLNQYVAVCCGHLFVAVCLRVSKDVSKLYIDHYNYVVSITRHYTDFLEK